MALFAKPKGGSSAARAARARRGHSRRRGRPLVSSNYRGSRRKRTKGAWLF